MEIAKRNIFGMFFLLLAFFALALSASKTGAFSLIKAQISKVFEGEKLIEIKPRVISDDRTSKQDEENSDSPVQKTPSEANESKKNENALPVNQTIREETGSDIQAVKGEKKEKKEEKSQKQEISWCELGEDYSLKNVVFSEIAWMGNEESASNEWIELKNYSNTILNLSGWQILTADGSLKISLKEGTSLAPGGFLLFERTDDSTVPSEKADAIYTGSLANSKEKLYLFDSKCLLQDKAEAAPDWPAGNNKTKQTMERRSDFLWQTSEEVGGTPRKENSQGNIGGSTQETLGASAVSSQGGSGLGPNVPMLVISEIMYDAVGSDQGKEWVEVFNASEFSSDLSQVKLYEGGVSHSLKLIQGSFVIPPNSYAVITNATSTQTLGQENYQGSLFKASFSLRNETGEIGEEIGLKYQNNLLDAVFYKSAWGGQGNGDSLQKQNSENAVSKNTLWISSSPTFGAINNNALFFLPDSVKEIDTGVIATTTEDLAGIGSSLEIVINEIAWMGTATSTSDEWIELYNNTSKDVDLAGWKILKNGEKFIEFATSTLDFYMIPATNYYLIERKTSKKKIGSILDNEGKPLADLLVGFGYGLSNKGDLLEVYDNKGKLSDRVGDVSGSKTWFAGSNKDKKTMARINSEASGSLKANWEDSRIIHGTPKAQNYE